MTGKLDKENEMNEYVVNPHDKIVKEFLSEKGTAESFFREYLPGEITAGLDFSTLVLSKESFVDKKLSEYFSDLLYEVKLKDQSIFIYLLRGHIVENFFNGVEIYIQSRFKGEAGRIV